MGNTPNSRAVRETGGEADPPAASVWAGPSCTVVRVTGEWDMTGCDQLRGMLADQVRGMPADQVRAGAWKLVVDLSDVAFLDLACLYALLEGARMTQRAGGTLQLASPQPVVVRMISLLGAGRLIAVPTCVAEVTAG